MNLTWHITKKDLTRFRLPLTGFALVLIARVVLGAALRAGDSVDVAWFNRIQSYTFLCLGLQALIMFALVAVLVHEDATVGTQVFWRTRPISGARLLGSKVLTLVLMFGALPLLVDLPWWLACSFGPAEIGGAAVNVLVWQALLVLPAFGLAVISETFGRYFTLAVVAAGLVVFTALMRIAYFPSPETLTLNLLLSRLALALVVVAAGLVVVIVRQFHSRRTTAAYVILVAIVIGAPLILGGWNSDFVGSWKGRTADASADTRAITVTPTAAKVVYGGDNDQPKSARWFDVTLKVDDSPQDLALAPWAAELTWSARSGTLRTSDAAIYYGGYFGGNRVQAVRRLLGIGEEVTDEETHRWWEDVKKEKERKFPTVKSVPPLPVEEQRRRTSLRFALRNTATLEPPVTRTQPELTTDFVLGRPRLLVELPIAPTARIDRGSFSVRVAEVKKYKTPFKLGGVPAEFEGFHAALVETQYGGPLLDAWRTMLHVETDALETEVWLFTRDRGDISWGWPIRRAVSLAYIEGVQISWQTATMTEPRVIRNGRWTALRSDWVQHVTLAFVTYDQVGRFRRTVKLGEVSESK